MAKKSEARPIYGWGICIDFPRSSYLIHNTMARTRRECMTAFVKDASMTWDECRESGYRVVRVIISPVA